MNNRNNLAITREQVITVIGLIASLIAIFVFVTGFESIQEIFNRHDLQRVTITPAFAGATHVAQTPVRNLAENTPTQVATIATPTQSPTSTPRPQPTTPPEIINSGNPGVTITIRDMVIQDAGSNVHLQVIAGGTPVENKDFRFFEAQENVAGKWAAMGRVAVEFATTDANGLSWHNLDSGMYALVDNPFSSWIQGSWGIQGGDGVEMVVFPVQDGRVTEITLHLGRLEVGVLNTSGNALTYATVYVHLQSSDIAGNIIASERGYYNTGKITDNRGLAEFLVGSGTYLIEIKGNFPCEDIFYNIRVQPNESLRSIHSLQCEN